jgi:hypothetical protein
MIEEGLSPLSEGRRNSTKIDAVEVPTAQMMSCSSEQPKQTRTTASAREKEREEWEDNRELTRRLTTSREKFGRRETTAG